MKECGVWKFVFSSSATVYGTPQNLPISEDHPVGIGITNPYGRSKFFIEEIIKDLCKAEKVLKIGYLWVIYGLIKIMIKETWLETDSNSLVTSVCLVTIKSGFIRLNHCRKGKKGTCISAAKCQWRRKKLGGDYSNLEWKKLAERNLVAQNTACRKLHKTTKSHEQCRKLLGMGMYRPNTCWKHWTN